MNTGTKMLHVPYKGATPAAVAVASGEVDAAMQGLGTVTALIQSGKLRLLAVSTPLLILLGVLGLLLRQPQRGFDVDHQVFITRTRQTLHQLIELRALQGHFVEAQFHERHTGGGFLAEFLGPFGHGLRLGCRLLQQ